MTGRFSQRQLAGEVAMLLVGCVLYALSVVLFIDPIHVIPGSVTGIAVVVKALFGTPIGVLNLIINVPLLLVAVFYLGKKLLVYTGITILLTSLLMDWWAVLPPFTEDMLLASVFGGVVMGIGLGLILKAGGTTGGTTVVGRLVVRKLPNLPIGTILMIGDFIIISAGTLLLRDWDLFLYSTIDLYVCVVAIDKVMYGFDVKSAMAIHTSQAAAVAGRLQAEIPCRVVRFQDGLVCYCKKSNVSKVQRAVQVEDPEAVCGSVNMDYSFGGVDRPE
ncbi:MAG: YitT family protein [Oscillibacter sp.]|nr:YitT family protein [Oscillibacter sp.]